MLPMGHFINQLVKQKCHLHITVFSFDNDEYFFKILPSSNTSWKFKVPILKSFVKISSWNNVLKKVIIYTFVLNILAKDGSVADCMMLDTCVSICPCICYEYLYVDYILWNEKAYWCGGEE